MEAVYDVAIVGGGPCGSFAALNLARQNCKVAVFEEHSEIGVPSHCAGHLSIKSLRRLDLYPLPAGIVENTFRGVVFHSSMSRQFRVRFSMPVTCVVDRVLFDKFIAEMAEKAGTRYFLDSRVESLVVDAGFVKGVAVNQENRLRCFSAKVTLDAEGMSSKLLRQTGLPMLDRSELVNGVEAEVDGVRDVETDMVEVFLGRGYAHDFFAWLIPLTDGKAKVGLAVRDGNPKDFLMKLMSSHPVASRKLRSAVILRTAFHPVSLGGPIAKSYSNGFLAVGDVASHVKPTTGGGVIWGLTCAKLAAEVIRESLRQGDTSSACLSRYQRLCEGVLGFDVDIMLKLRKGFGALSDKQVDNALGFCARFGLDKTLESVDELDFQGRSFLHVLRSPRLLVALFYFLHLYLSVNH